MEINVVDILILIPLLIFAFHGYKKGLIIGIATLVALVLGIYSAIYFSDFTAGMLTQSFDIDEGYISIVAFVVTFIVVILLVLLLGKILEKLVNILMLGFLNKLAGALFGILKGALLVSVIIFIVNYFDPQSKFVKKEAIEKSILYKQVEPIAPWLYDKLNLEKLKKSIPEPSELI